jgi:mannose-6-phosphate isomerase-like protein (cupin superfamily)
MPRVSKESATEGGDYGIVVDASEDLDGYSVNFITFRQNIDMTPLLKGLPEDRCQSPHWGYVFKGRLTFRYGDREEVYDAGDAFYAPPGHVPVESEPGTEYVQFSPAEEMHKTNEVILRNFEALQSASTV